jgi:hypothetical protein
MSVYCVWILLWFIQSFISWLFHEVPSPISSFCKYFWISHHPCMSFMNSFILPSNCSACTFIRSFRSQDQLLLLEELNFAYVPEKIQSTLYSECLGFSPGTLLRLQGGLGSNQRLSVRSLPEAPLESLRLNHVELRLSQFNLSLSCK